MGTEWRLLGDTYCACAPAARERRRLVVKIIMKIEGVNDYRRDVGMERCGGGLTSVVVTECQYE